MVVVKCCSGCGVVKSLDDFHRNRAAADGYMARCKECRSAYSRRHYEENRDKIAERGRRYREENPDKIAEKNRRYWGENRDKLQERNRRYYEENRDREREKRRRWREENRDKISELNRRYREENRDKLLESSRRYYEENRDKALENKRRYREENPEYLNRRNSRYKRHYKSATESAATKCGPWSEAEVAILMADDGRTMVAKALELGRTYNSCQGKRAYLRRAGVTN